MFRAVHWAARRGLREAESFSSDAKKQEARRTGVRGETYAYWYLRRQGYIFVARNYTPRGIKGEIDRVWLLFGNELPPLHRLKEALLVLVNMEGPVLLEML